MRRMAACWVAGVAACIGIMACGPVEQAPDVEGSLQTLVDHGLASRGSNRGLALHVDSPLLRISWQGAAGLADPANGEPMAPEHPVRIASNTKTYIAAAVLRLWEDGRIDLDDPIDRYLPGAFVESLERGGYRPDQMTIRHLLTHTSGLDDHGNDRYAEKIVADPSHRWSRAEQLAICLEDGRPQGSPGEVYRYSDTGYILLGEILERVTDSPFAEAVWGLIDRDRLGLSETWFESLEPRPPNVRERAHQFYGELDVTGFDPSFDLWGGGGIVTTVGDLARFTRALFTGQVFREPATLDTMLSTFDGLEPALDAGAGDLPPGAYRMGVWVLEVDGLTVYRHTGFWCTSASYVPELDLVITATANDNAAKALLSDLVDGSLERVVAHIQHHGSQVGPG